MTEGLKIEQKEAGEPETKWLYLLKALSELVVVFSKQLKAQNTHKSRVCKFGK